MKNWNRGSVLGFAVIVVACSASVLFATTGFVGAAPAELSGEEIPTQCVDHPELDWRCIVIARDEPGIASQLFEDNCLQPTLLAPFDINKEGQVMSYVLVGRVIESCAKTP